MAAWLELAAVAWRASSALSLSGGLVNAAKLKQAVARVPGQDRGIVDS